MVVLMKNFCFDTICNFFRESQELQRFKFVCEFIGKSAVIKYRYILLVKKIPRVEIAHFHLKIAT